MKKYAINVIYEGPEEEIKKIQNIYDIWSTGFWSTKYHFPNKNGYDVGAIYRIPHTDIKYVGYIGTSDTINHTPKNTNIELVLDSYFTPQITTLQKIQTTLAPNSKTYWYMYSDNEIIGATNDIHHKYIPGDYTITTELPSTHPLAQKLCDGEPISKERLQTVLSEIYGQMPLVKLIQKVKEANKPHEYILISPIAHIKDSANQNN